MLISNMKFIVTTHCKCIMSTLDLVTRSCQTQPNGIQCLIFDYISANIWFIVLNNWREVVMYITTLTFLSHLQIAIISRRTHLFICSLAFYIFCYVLFSNRVFCIPFHGMTVMSSWSTFLIASLLYFYFN